MKRILTIQDISCVGQCSLTVALPIISAMGVETGILPSAVLSTHTGGFKNFTFRDLTEDLPLIQKHWLDSNIDFDGIYTGYVGSKKQLSYIIDIIDSFRNKAKIVLVDPAMADNGKLYFGFPEDFPKEMLKLCQKADIIAPNITEACLLLGIPYQEHFSKEEILSIISQLAEITKAKVVLTGVSFEDGKLGVAIKEKDEIQTYFTVRIPTMFHGTGDIFASALFGGLENELSLLDACKLACQFVVESIKLTLCDVETHRYGVHFEKAIPFLINHLNK